MALNISDEYVIGFVEGEGCFYIGIVPSSDTHQKKQVIYFFKVAQNPSGKVVLDYIKKRLGCGYIKPNDRNDSSDRSLAFVVRDLKSLTQLVIPFFDGKLIIKRNNFNKFKKVVEMVNEKKHLTEKGMNEIIDIAYSMNKRKRKIRKTRNY
ncbi:hypothetical protein A3C23_03855 [Candidatus Roizmanbacteria bacterium RIFCSPHIGHO2_02_FULL_37_13b]|uniref:Homing endonuclease LAGLIDADG domain-containing protein n=1 Tax=Candidatus Roizmanbacteria bacterium RIFCSPLOWO2_02_FULL_36_11 TaxID=1802071 RepID=A0A1F7JI13_9BACT|nr:MAG: hypothetical protein A3C23_03855 [Candidatus Roizmanbacteria bacterium RIFCSPHIGHO2_02_FULL_37_13b]OGK55235.1 MAG: hypothetical protein A3H78_04325 [Candidatus Roizmanbacteria bacterium RIFCSPLOWO2_02_FULL_36_11]